MSEKEIRLVDQTSQGERIDHGMSGRIQEGTTAAATNAEHKGMTGGPGAVRPDSAPPKPVDSAMSAKPKDS